MINSFSIFIAALFLLVSGPFTLANEILPSSNATSTLEIIDPYKIYPQQIVTQKIIKSSNKVYLVISGIALPGLKISTKKQSHTNNLNEADKALATVNSEGIFKVSFFGKALETLSIPVHIKTPKGLKTIDVSIKKDIDSQKYILTEPVNSFIKKSKPYSLSLGLGFNYTSFEQKTPSFNSFVNFDSTEFPSFSIRGSKVLNNRWSAHLDLLVSTGKISNSSINVNKTKFTRTDLSFFLKFRPYSSSFKVLGLNNYFIFGTQHIVSPYFSRSTNSFSLNNIKTTYLDLGLGADYIYSNTWGFSSDIGLQTPILRSGETRATPYLSLRTKTSAEYHWTRSLTIGPVWFMQLQKIEFEDRSFTISSFGKQSIFISNIEFQIKYFF